MFHVSELVDGMEWIIFVSEGREKNLEGSACLLVCKIFESEDSNV
jgi:hypothetical protein